MLHAAVWEMANEPQLTMGSRRFVGLIPDAVDLLRMAWQSGGAPPQREIREPQTTSNPYVWETPWPICAVE